MPSTTSALNVAADTRPNVAATRLWYVFGALAPLLIAYIVYSFVTGNGSQPVWVSGWGVDAFELTVAVLCLSKAFVRQTHRGMPIALGCALLSWCAGDIALTIETLGGRAAPAVSIVNLFYLGFYPLAYIAVVLFMRDQVRRLTAPSWLDGAVAGFGGAAVCSAFLYHDLLRSTHGGRWYTIINTALPAGDLLLLALVIGATAVYSGRRKAPWIMLAGACILIAVGDTFSLFQYVPLGSSSVGSAFNAIAWPGAFMLMAMAVWLRPSPTDPLAPQRPTGFLLPAIATAAALSILLRGTMHRLTNVSIGLATVTLVLVGIRFALSARGLRVLTEQRHRQSMTDELTGLGNRRYLFHVLNTFFNDQADPLQPTRQLAFLFIDLDHFKEINDSFGHSAGDELLRQLGPRLTSSLRGTDILVRLGGDEFAGVLLDADAKYATAVADRLMASLVEPFVIDLMSATVGASIGIAIAPTHASDAAGLLRCADVAMYRAKLGHNTIETYDQQLDDDGNLLLLAEELRVAVQEKQFVLHYQPQLDLRTGELSGVEALIRWPHARLGMMPPLKFIPVAEEAGLMPSLTALVLDDALRQCSVWRAAGNEIDMSINVSPSNLLDTGFTAMIRMQLERHRLPASVLVLEITETCIITDYERSRAVIAELRDLGLTISIDDFGAGFTSLAYLSDLAVGELKLDRTFIVGTSSNDKIRDIELVRSTIELGHALGLRVVAEGVEDLETLETLGQLGCDLAQGYFISRPMPAEDLVLNPPVAMVAEAVLS
jgi:diguanylate cyclase